MPLVRVVVCGQISCILIQLTQFLHRVLSVSVSLSLCLSVSLSVSFCLSLSLSLSHTHTHTHTQVTWTVLLPAAEALGNGYQFINFGSINMHAMNVVALLTDFLINDVTFSVDDIWILMLWVTW